MSGPSNSNRGKKTTSPKKKPPVVPQPTPRALLPETAAELAPLRKGPRTPPPSTSKAKPANVDTRSVVARYIAKKERIAAEKARTSASVVDEHSAEVHRSPTENTSWAQEVEEEMPEVNRNGTRTPINMSPSGPRTPPEPEPEPYTGGPYDPSVAPRHDEMMDEAILEGGDDEVDEVEGEVEVDVYAED